MYNDFVMAGPAHDPAGISKEKDVLKALKNIASKEALFLSRPDDSGTYEREKSLWKAAGIDPYGPWYKAH
ncbi:MAG: hypothetical protein OEV42_05615 [Deltaproteobacteria bacterium]|nr:hypothetical protein [Deltaproteobacteria bacterium]